MKKLIIFSFLFGIMLMINSQNTYASNFNPDFGEVEPCHQYWWPDLDWNGPQYKSIEIDGCFYLCVFHRRDTPAGRIEFQITEFVRLKSSGCTTNHSFDQIKRLLYLQLFQNLALEFSVPDSVIPMAIQESLCRLEEPFTPNPSGNPLDPFSVDSLYITIPVDDLSITDSILIAPIIPAPIGDTYTIYIDQLWNFCPDTVCCRAYYFTYFDSNEELLRVHYDSLSPKTYLGPDTCKGNYCEENCSSLIWNYDVDSTGGFFKKTNYDYFNNSKDLNIYPNPVSKHLTLELDNVEEGLLTISIFDINGNRIIMENQSKKGKVFKHTLNLSNIINGTYFIEIDLNNNKFNRKFQVE